MSTFNITLKKQWFTLTDSGEKEEEYRIIKPYWISRLFYCDLPKEKSTDHLSYAEDVYHDLTVNGYSWEEVARAYWLKPKPFTKIFAVNGYGNRPSWTRKYLGVEVREGHEEWGAEPGVKYFVIKLGEKV